uniref:Uncharacterized protein n=1 Tax=Anguilla anguilla TaxID=7936 RepID=A0A0E9RNN7_ANGAN
MEIKLIMFYVMFCFILAYLLLLNTRLWDDLHLNNHLSFKIS